MGCWSLMPIAMVQDEGWSEEKRVDMAKVVGWEGNVNFVSWARGCGEVLESMSYVLEGVRGVRVERLKKYIG